MIAPIMQCRQLWGGLRACPAPFRRRLAIFAISGCRIVLSIAILSYVSRDMLAQQSHPSFADLQKRAEQARRSDQTQESVSLYRQAVTVRPSWAEGWWYLGTGLYELHRYSEARDAFHRLAVLRPKDGSAWAVMGLSEFELGKYDESLNHLPRAEELGMGDNREMVLVVRYHVVLLLNRSGQFERARDHMTAFAALGDVSPPIINAVGLSTLRFALLPTEIPPEKRELVTKAGQATWEPYLAGHPEQADHIFEEIVASYPREQNVHYAYGVHLLDSDPEQAMKEFQRELEITPAHVLARVQLVYLYLKQGDSEKGTELAREALKLDPNFFLTHNLMGRALLAGGHASAAIEELKTAVRLEPTSPESHFSLSEAYRNAGRTAEAAKERAEFERLKKPVSRTPGVMHSR